MAWVRLDDDWFAHPKVLRAGKDGQLLYVAALCYANRYGTDGLITRDVLPMLAATTRTNAKAAAAALVTCALWEEHPDGWEIHDYHVFQPTAAELAEERGRALMAKAEAGRKGGIASGIARRRAAIQHEANEAEAKQTGTKDEANPKQKGNQTRTKSEPNRSPVPDPYPKQLVTGKNNPPPRCPEGGEGRKLAIATRAAELQADQANGTIKHRSAWVRSAVDSILGEHGDRIDRLCREFSAAPDDVLAAAVNGDTHSLRYFGEPA